MYMYKTHTHTHTCASQLHNYAHWDRVVISLPSSYIAMKNVFNTAILVSSMWYPSLLHICDINLLILACLLTNIPKLFSAVHTFPACLLFVVNIQTRTHTYTCTCTWYMPGLNAGGASVRVVTHKPRYEPPYATSYAVSWLTCDFVMFNLSLAFCVLALCTCWPIILFLCSNNYYKFGSTIALLSSLHDTMCNEVPSPKTKNLYAFIARYLYKHDHMRWPLCYHRTHTETHGWHDMASYLYRSVLSRHNTTFISSYVHIFMYNIMCMYMYMYMSHACAHVHWTLTTHMHSCLSARKYTIGWPK